MQYSPMRAPGPTTASEETRAVGAMTAEGSIPDTLGDAAVTVLNAVVEIVGRDGPEGLVVKRFLAQPFLEVLFEIVESLELIRLGGQPHSLRGAEELLITAVHQEANLIADQNAGPLI